MRNISIQAMLKTNEAKLLLDNVDTGVLISLAELEHRCKLFGLVGKKSIIDAVIMKLHNACTLTAEEKAFFKEILKEML